MKKMFVAFVALVLLGTAFPGWADEHVVMGVGTFTLSETRVVEPLQPPCVSLVTRTGTVEFAGLIASLAANGLTVSRTISEACTDPAHGTFQAEIQLRSATVGGLTGNLVIVIQGVVEGRVTDPSGARTRGHGTITGISGKLRGASGKFQYVGQATATPGSPASAFNTYFAEIHVKRDH